MLALTALKQKFQTLRQFDGLNQNLIEALESLLPQMDAWTLHRLNPLVLAKEQGFELLPLLDILIYAVKIGLFDFFWTPICPGCGGIEYTSEHLNAFKNGRIQCTTCVMEIELDLAQHMEVAFHLNPAMGDLSQVVSPVLNFDNYLRYYFSAHLQHSQALKDYIQRHFKGFRVLEPDQQLELKLDTQPQTLWRLINLQSHSQLLLQIGEPNTPSPPQSSRQSDLVASGFSPAEQILPAGHNHFWIRNHESVVRGLTLWTADFDEFHQILSEHPNRYEPFLTAQMLLNTQSFRDLFNIQALDPDLHLNIGSQTVLFSDLKGSTAMYEQRGDYQAYQWVQRHFQILTESTRLHAGSVVKTMGDAIMATFTRPQDGILAALEMLQRIQPLQSEFPALGLKLGLHQGPALVVNANDRLDYFGQTVNQAARIQGLAEAGELWLSESMIETAQPLLQAAGFDWERREALLKGIAEKVVVYRCWPFQAAA